MLFRKKTVEDVSVEGKRVLLRCDFNVPLDMASAPLPTTSGLRRLCRPSGICSITAPR